jgi:hypothetical protein
LLVTAYGGSNGSRTRLWKLELQRLADELGNHHPWLSLPTWDQQVEQDRAPHVLSHLPELAGTPVDQPGGVVKLICPTCGAWPNTFERFMPNDWFDALEPLAALDRLRQTPLDVANLLNGLSDAQLDQPSPDGGWAIRNVVTHLRDAQDVLAYRVELFQQEENPALEAKAVWAWAANEEERPPTAHQVFATYQASRQATLRQLEQIRLAHWWRTGRHQEFGVVTLRQQVSYFAAHELTHLSQLAALHDHWLEGG